MCKKFWLPILVIVIFLGLLLGFPSKVVLAAEPSLQAPVKEISSFELFWPIVAGRVEGDRWYSLKLIKENLKSTLVFNVAEKSEYQLFLAVKRVVEIEKLLTDQKLEGAKKTVALAERKIGESEANFLKAKESGYDFKEIGPLMETRLNNIEQLLLWLSSQNSQNEELLQVLFEKVTTFNAKV